MRNSTLLENPNFDYKVWQVLRFQISKALISIIIDILQEKLKIKFIKQCYCFYQNL